MKLRDWLDQGPFSLALSAGFFGFYAHCGLVKALWENGFKPKAVMGSSAGAMVSALLANNLSPQEMEKIFVKAKKDDFWDLKLGFGLLEGKKFKNLLEQHLPHKFENLSLPLSVSTFNLKKLKTQSFQSGLLVDPVRASCCFPIMFHPVRHENLILIDGGVRDWLGVDNPYFASRTLIHCLEPDGIISNKIKNNSLKKAKDNDFVFILDKTITMGPNRFHLAQEAIDLAYKQTNLELNS
jgi:NTE family protein